MTAADINASREMLVQEMKQDIGDYFPDFPFDDIRAGNWKVVISLLCELASRYGRSSGRAFQRLAKHAKDCQGEESLMLHLLRALNSEQSKRWAYNDKAESVTALLGVTRDLDQQVVDELFRTIAKYWLVRDIESVVAHGYVPSIDIENELVARYKESESHLIEIQRMQPLWHAMRLHAEMRDLTVAKASAIPEHAQRGL